MKQIFEKYTLDLRTTGKKEIQFNLLFKYSYTNYTMSILSLKGKVLPKVHLSRLNLFYIKTI